MKYEIDNVDRKILAFLQADSRKPFLEIARELKVSGGTVHARVNRLKEEGVIKGSKIIINHDLLGFSVSAFIGINATKASSFKDIQKRLKSIPEVVEVHYTTGAYSLLAKIIVPNIEALYKLLSENLQALPEIQATETFVILDTAIDRELSL